MEKILRDSVSLLMLILISTNILASFSLQNLKAYATFSVHVVDSVTNEGLNGINVNVTWGYAMDIQRTDCTDSGSGYFFMDDNYVGHVMINAWDEMGRYQSKSKLTHVSFAQSINATASETIELDRVIPLQSSHSGTYIKKLILDRDFMYSLESAYVMLDLYCPYVNAYLRVDKPSDMGGVDVIGGENQAIPFYESNNQTVVLRLYNRDYSHFEKTGTFNISLQAYTVLDVLTLESAQFALTLKPSLGYDDYQLRVKVVDSQTNEPLSATVVDAWWGSTLNTFKRSYTSSNGFVTLDLGAYPYGKVQLRFRDSREEYSSDSAEVTMTENPITETIALQRIAQGQGSVPPISPWIALAVLIVLSGGALIGWAVFRNRRKLRQLVQS